MITFAVAEGFLARTVRRVDGQSWCIGSLSMWYNQVTVWKMTILAFLLPEEKLWSTNEAKNGLILGYTLITPGIPTPLHGMSPRVQCLQISLRLCIRREERSLVCHWPQGVLNKLQECGLRVWTKRRLVLSPLRAFYSLPGTMTEIGRCWGKDLTANRATVMASAIFCSTVKSSRVLWIYL
jgi:hypothetical protein